jgi:hypothetical protein
VRRRTRDAGFVTLQFVVAVAWSLLLLVLVANFLVDLYARGAVRDALDDGVRAGMPSSRPVAACEARAEQVLSGLVRGPLVTATVRCDARDGSVTAEARVSLRSWLPMLVPDWRMTLHAVGQREP